jgi:hypothetical protein
VIKLPIDLPALFALMQRSSGKVDSPTFARRVRVESLTLNTTMTTASITSNAVTITGNRYIDMGTIFPSPVPS